MGLESFISLPPTPTFEKNKPNNFFNISVAYTKYFPLFVNSKKEGRECFIYGYMASDIIMVKDHSDSEKEPAATWATLSD